MTCACGLDNDIFVVEWRLLETSSIWGIFGLGMANLVGNMLRVDSSLLFSCTSFFGDELLCPRSVVLWLFVSSGL